MKKHITFTAVLLLLALLAAPCLAAPAQTADEKKAEAEITRNEARAKRTASGLRYVVLRQGKGERPDRGQRIEAHYVGRFLDGRIFDQSLGRAPFAFKVGMGQVIPAWDEALIEMKLGEKRALIVPPELGYGRQGAGNVIPPNTTLYFEVERLR